MNADADAFTLVDADNKGIPEVVIRKNITSSIVMFTVAGYADGKIVSESFHDEKYFGDLKYNGWNTTSSGNSLIVRYIPNSDKLKCDSIVTSERVEGELVYSVCGKSATNEQYNKACDMFYALPDAIWLDKTEANIKAVFGITAETYGLEPWQKAYLVFAAEDVPDFMRERCDYRLLYVDGDKIPELFISGPDSASGERICSYKSGQLVVQQLRRTGGSSYIAGEGLVYNSQGKSGYYSTSVYRLTENGFISLFEGDEEVNYRDGGISTYYILNGSERTEVTKEEFNAAIKAVYNRASATSLWGRGDSYETVCEQIKNCTPTIPDVPETPTQPETPSTPATPSDIIAPPKPETPTTPTSPSDIG
ncbi:MAG: hypothetical protein IKM67_03040 [Clostridia bacterium]|nr:hypothetical protein [Clostridia bacterium]MBR3865671.1 hypothetical protein [Clostridia bacterium]